MADTRYPVQRDTTDLLSHPDQGLMEQERQQEIADKSAAGGGFTHAFSATGASNLANDNLSAGAVIAKCEAVGVYSDAESLYTPATGKYAAPQAGWYLLTASYHTIGPAVLLTWVVPGVSAGPQKNAPVDEPWMECGGLVYISTPGDIYLQVTPSGGVPGDEGYLRLASIAMLG